MTKQRRPLKILTRYRLSRKERRGEKISEADHFIFRELRPGDTAVDCGANVGLITALMAARGAQVHAFEPDSFAFESLQSKFIGQSRVHLHKQAVSNKPGKMKLFFRHEHAQDPVKFSVGSTLHAGKTDINLETFTEVDVITLSQFLRGLPRVRLLKLDIEGAECDVLEDLLEHNMFDRIDLTLVETHETWIPELKPRLERIVGELKSRNIKNVFLNWI